MFGTDSKKQKNIVEAESNTSSFISVFATAFTTVFLAELGDKTQIATLLLSAQSGKPLVVLIGAALALICSSLVGVLLGRLLANTMPIARFKYMAGLLMIILGFWLGIPASEKIISSLFIQSQ